MNQAPKIVLQLPLSNPDLLPDFVEACLRDQAALIAVVGSNAEHVHDRIDELIIGDGSDVSRFILPSFHADETVEEALDFARICEPVGAQTGKLVKL